MVISYWGRCVGCLPIFCCQRRPAALIWIRRNRFRIIRNIVPFVNWDVMSDKPEDPGDGVEARDHTDRRVRADANATSTRCFSQPWRCSPPLEWTLRSERSRRRPASVSGPFTATFRSAPTSSRPSSVAKSMPAQTLRRSWLPSTSPARRWLDGCSVTRIYRGQARTRQGPPFRRPGLRLLARVLRAATRPALRTLLNSRHPPARSAPISLPRSFWVRSRACACTLTRTATRGAWSLC